MLLFEHETDIGTRFVYKNSYSNFTYLFKGGFTYEEKVSSHSYVIYLSSFVTGWLWQLLCFRKRNRKR